ncbi:hypothetical protein DYI37_03945 [Fulvimarina endophytica]|uniref:Uncharacterized protein n=2 Tax=Fulvimarina endophytica TaxID=2293836 RepID=A0A371X8C6_9HYPH|nr:hypothetical protein DYI37_03945 [Fulvimarina endophytica]
MDIAIETPKGGTRRGVGRDGSAWEVTMPAHYGDFKGTKGADGDPVDVYVGEDPSSDRVFVVDQKDADTGKFDEVKVFVGVTSEQDVAQIYEGAFSDGRALDRVQAVTETTVDGLKNWLKSGKTGKAFAAAPARQPSLPKKPVTTMLKQAGGIDPTSPLAGNLRAMGINSRTAPGLFRKGGRGAADNFVWAENPLFHDGPDDGNGYVREEAIIEGLRREMAGDPLRTPDEIAAVQPEEQAFGAEQEFEPKAERNRSPVVADSATEIARLIDVYGFPTDPEFFDLAMSFVDRGANHEDAVIAASERLLDTELTPDEAQYVDASIGIPFFGNDAPGDGRLPWEADTEAMGSGEPRVEDARPAAPAEGGSLGAGEESGGGERQAGSRSPDEEVGADGKPQLVIPGAEKVRDQDLLQRRASEGKRSTKPQADMDIGMFGSSKDQTDLVDLARATKPETKTDAQPETPTVPEATETEKPADPATGAEIAPVRAEEVQTDPEPEAAQPKPAKADAAPADSASKSFVTDEETGMVREWLKTLEEFYDDPTWGRSIKRTAQKIERLLGSAYDGDSSYIDRVLDRRNPFDINRYGTDGSKAFNTTEAISDEAYDLFDALVKRIEKGEKNPPQTEGARTDERNEMAGNRQDAPEGQSAEAARPTGREGPSGDLAGSEGGRSAPSDGRGPVAGDEGGRSEGVRDGDPSPDTGADTGREAGTPTVRDGDRRTDRDTGRGRGRSDFRITEPDEIGAGGQKTKFDNNLEAIHILEDLQGMTPTEAEKRLLARYVGWGGIPQAFKRPDGTYAEGWESRAKKLEKALSKEELAAARRSTQDAHYTSPQVVAGVWKAMERFGFKNGRVLEPSVGVGNFLGLRPADVKARFTGVEYDNITAAIAKALYGASDIHHQGFQDFTAPDGYFDAVIGNPPFGSQKLFDPKRPHLNNFSIHNMFFAKSVDLLRQDGVLGMVVSNSFLDAVVKDKARNYIASKTEFLGAIRLPNNAFSKNAGTDVTTDIIFLRKLKDGEAPTGQTWTGTQYVTDPNGGEDIPLNEYFVRNPDMMLGDFGSYGTMYRAGATALVAREGQDLTADLNAAIAKLPRDVMGDWTNQIVERSNAAQVDKTVKVGSMFLDGDGNVMVRGEDFGTKQNAEPSGLTGKGLDRAKGMIEVRDVLTELRALQLDPNATDRQIDAARQDLNTAYDAFVKANGPISTDANRRIFGEDPTWPQLAALEDRFDKGISAAIAKKTGETPRAPSAEKAAIFTKRTQSPYKAPTKAANAKDALTASLSVAGRVDLDMMSRMTDRSETSLFDELSGLLFKTPSGDIVTREEYLSGNVKAKLAQAREAAKTNRDMAGNVEALEAVQPADIEAADIDVKPGAHWVPPQYMADFIDHITGAGGGKASYSPVTGQWNVTLGQVKDSANVEYATDRADIGATIRAALEQRGVQIYDVMADKSRILNQAASEAATEKSKKIADEWRRWVWTDDARRRDMAAIYNERFNTTIAREYDGSHLTFPGKVGDDIVELRPSQKNAVWRIVQGGTTLLDHVVGAGKTFTMVAGAMELRRTGFARKPMLVVPNHLVGQWAEDFVKLYPGARILAATKKDFEKQNRKRLFARISTGDWDAVIVAHSSFGKVELDHDFQKEILDEQLTDIEDAIVEMKRASKEGAGDDRTVKQAEKQRESLKERLKRLAESGAKDDNLTFGELGVDALFVDEAHEFKNLAFVTKQRGVMGLGNPTGSQKAMDMFMKTQFILRRNGQRNVVHATGTPISNTMAEMYTVGRYLDYDDMRSRGVIHFDAWARQFGEVVQDWEISPSGKYKLTSRFAKFVNMPELMQRYLTFADVINRDDINRQLAKLGKKLPIPKIKGGKPQNIIVPRSDDQAAYIGIPLKDADGNETENYLEGSLVWRSENMPKRPEKGADNMLKIMGDARKAALDMRLIDPDYGDNPKSKINNAADRIRALYDQWNADRGTQLVFIDLSTPKAAKGREAARIRDLIDAAEGKDADKAEAAQAELDKLSPDEIDALSGDFSVYDDLKAKLIRRGIPEAEIAFIHDANTELQKDELFGKVRSGRIRVLFGSTQKMGAGMNVQNRLVGLHHMDAPWRPSDLEQREGRIIRQGNELYAADPDGFEIEINRYATERTLDARMWQTIEAKARFIEQVRKGAGGREIEDVGGEAANAAEMKAAASGNPDILAEMSLRKTLRTLENQRREHMREITRTADTLDMMRRQLARAKREAPLYRQDAKIKTDEFRATIGKTSFDKTNEAAEALGNLVKKKTEAGATKGEIGTLYGVKLRFDVADNGIPFVSVETAVPHEAPFSAEDSAIGVIMKLRNRIRASEENAIASERLATEKAEDIAKLEARGVTQWPKEKEFEETREKHNALIAKLRPKAKPAPKAETDGAQFTAFEGWSSIDAAAEPRLSEDEQQAILEIVRQVSGLSMAKFYERIDVPINNPGLKAWGRAGRDGETVAVGGFYQPVGDMIGIALNNPGDGRSTAYHESFHRLQRLFLSDQEKALLANETETLRAIVAKTPGREAQALRMSQIEVEAEAFAIYADRMDAGGPAPIRIKGRIRTAWDRILKAVKRTRNYLRGLGYQTFEDVFDTARSGKMKDRDARMASGSDAFSEMGGAQFDIAPDLAGRDLEPQRRTQSFLAKGQPIDRAIAAPFQYLPGGLTKDRRLAMGEKAFSALEYAITKWRPHPEGRFAWMDGALETARAGLIDRYGLDPAYVERDRDRAQDERRVMMQGTEVLKSLSEQKVGIEEAKVLQAILSGEPVNDAAMEKLAEPIRVAIDDLGQEAVNLGLLSAESFERNRGAYLHRVYLKHESEQNGLARMASKIMGNNRKKIIGDQFKGRGMFFEVPLEKLVKSDPEWSEARRGVPQKGEKVRILDRVQDDMMGGKGKTLERAYWPADRKIPETFAGFQDRGTWEVRGRQNGRFVLWRDYTKAERGKMGEILDARYTIGKTYMMMAHDLATGRFYQDIAKNEEWARIDEPAGKWKNAGDVSRLAIDTELQWVRVPDTAIPNSGGKRRWGALSGMFVRAEIWRDLNEIDVMNRPGTWRMLLTQWKLNKTARSPVVHMNNVMSNLMFMDFGDVRFQDLASGIRSYAKGDRNFREAMENGAFGGDMMSQEIRTTILQPILDDLVKQQQGGAENSFLARAGLLGKLADRVATALKTADRKMIDAYRIEDEVFRMATYMRRRELGDSPKAAADHARQQFLDYDIRAPWVNAARNTVLPFISYSYRATPLVAKAIATRPWKLAKYFAIAYAVNALAYAWDGEDEEEKERASLREQEQGWTWLGVPRMLRMPYRDEHGNPVFLDIRRWIPSGDVFDTNQGSSALPIPAPLQFGGPVQMAFEMAFNKQAFTGEEIANRDTDTGAEIATKHGEYLWKAWMPSAAWVPGSWYWEKLGNAARGATDAQGRPYGVGEALASSVGIKLKPQDVEAGLAWRAYDLRKIQDELRTEARRLARQRERNMISQSAFDAAMANIMEKLDRLGERGEELGRVSQ